jgi:hypothetical protein
MHQPENATRTLSMNEPKIETVRFPNGHEALLAHVDQDTPANAVIAALKLPQPNALACLNGGTAELSDDLKADLSRLLADGLARVAAEYAITLLTGGTDAGIFSLLGDGLAKWERKAPCIGVTPAAPVTWPGREKGDTPLEPHHSHFVVVEGKEWGDETRTMYSVAQALGRDCPSIAVFAGGGDVTLREMQANVDHGREMILVAGSGRKTDAVLDILAGSNTSDRALQEIASKGRITRFEIGGSPEQFARLVESRILPAC